MKTKRMANLGLNILRAIIILATLAAGFLNVSAPAQAAGIQTRSDLTLKRSDHRGASLVYVTPEYTLEGRMVDGNACQVIRIAGYGATGQPGLPELPVRGAMLGIPVQAVPSLAVTASVPQNVPLTAPLCPAEVPQIQIDPVSGLPANAGQPAVAQASLQNAFWPARSAELVSTAFLRSQRVAQLKFNPFQYNPVTGSLRVFRTIQVVLNFNTPAASQATATAVQEPAYEAVLSDLLINAQQAAAWRIEPNAQTRVRSAANAPTGNLPSYRLSVDQDGLYQVTFEALAAVAGADLQPGLASSSFRIFSGGDYTIGREIAIRVVDGGDGAFNPGDALLFYGQKVDTRYTAVNAYYLTWGGDAGLRMPAAGRTPQGAAAAASFSNNLHVEQNPLMVGSMPSGVNKDVFYWAYISGAATKTYPVTLVKVVTDPAKTIIVSGLLRSYSGNSQHHTRVYLNDNLVDEALWPVGSAYSFSRSVPASYLVDGANTIKLVTLLDNGITSSAILLNWFEIQYDDLYAAESDSLAFSLPGGAPVDVTLSGYTTNQVDIYDITDTNNVAVVSGAVVNADNSLSLGQNSAETRRYLAQTPARRLSPRSIVRDQVSQLKSNQNGADYILITHADFLAEAQQLAAWRASQGLRTKVVDVQDIYDEFSAGQMSAPAIRDFLAYAYANWQAPAPQYVLLFGDGHYDPRDYLNSHTPTFIPPYMAFVDLWLGENASENSFVTVSGSDNLPDMFLGRLPVNNKTQAAAVVTKLIAYDQNTPSDGWNEKVLFIADNTDSAGNFANYSDKIANDTSYLPVDYTAQKIYYGITHTTVASAQTDILAKINAGALIVNYVGHGSSQIWATEKLFQNTSVASLTNTDRQPLVASIACLTSSFHTPNSTSGVEYPSLTDKLVLAPTTGAIAAVGSPGMGLAAGQDYLNRGLFRAIFTESKLQVGAALTQAKLFAAANTGAYPDMTDLFMLTGDPATRLQVKSTGPASVSGWTWDDLDKDGVQDGNEPSLSGVTVSLYNADGVQQDSVTSDTQGQYDFADLQPGSYRIGFVAPIGYKFSPANAAGADADSDANPTTGVTPVFTLVAGESETTTDAGLFNVPTAVTVSDFTVMARSEGGVMVTWTTLVEYNTLGFHVYRRSLPDGAFERITSELILAQNLGGMIGGSYELVDLGALPGMHYEYKLVDLEVSGEIAQLGVRQVSIPASVQGSLIFIPIVRK